MREQREVIYKERMQIINSTEDLMKPVILPMIQRTVHRIVNLYTQGDSKDWNLQAILNFAWSNMVGEDKLQLDNLKGLTADGIYNLLMSFVDENYKQKQRQLADPQQMLEFEKVIILRVVDEHWTAHIDAMDQLRQSIGLRGYGQMNPLVEYQEEGFRMFEEMIADIDFGVTRLFMKAQIRQNIRR